MKMGVFKGNFGEDHPSNSGKPDHLITFGAEIRNSEKG